MPTLTPDDERRMRESLHTQVNNWFQYHKPIGNQAERYAALREKAGELARMIVDLTPVCADQTAALRLLRECTMTANAAIACNEGMANAHRLLENR